MGDSKPCPQGHAEQAQETVGHVGTVPLPVASRVRGGTEPSVGFFTGLTPVRVLELRSLPRACSVQEAWPLALSCPGPLAASRCGCALEGLWKVTWLLADICRQDQGISSQENPHLPLPSPLPLSSLPQENLMLSILPKHVADEMLKDMKKDESQKDQQQFNTMYMYRHENVRCAGPRAGALRAGQRWGLCGVG